MAMDHLQFGETRVDLLFDGFYQESPDRLKHNSGELAREAILTRRGESFLRVDVNCFLIRGPRGVELVDVGAGSSRGSDYGRARDALAALGIAPGMVVRIFITHMHFDHVLGLMDGDAPHFPRAEVIVPAADLAHYTDAAERARVPGGYHFVWDDAARIALAYAGRLQRADFGPLMPGVEMIPIPGHSPGQAAYRFTLEGETLLLFGDLMHFQDAQAADPDLGLTYDNDPLTAARSRRAVLGRAADGGWIVGGGHVSGFGRVLREGDAFRIVPA